VILGKAGREMMAGYEYVSPVLIDHLPLFKIAFLLGFALCKMRELFEP
jgi:hypothetical protein